MAPQGNGKSPEDGTIVDAKSQEIAMRAFKKFIYVKAVAAILLFGVLLYLFDDFWMLLGVAKHTLPSGVVAILAAAAVLGFIAFGLTYFKKNVWPFIKGSNDAK